MLCDGLDVDCKLSGDVNVVSESLVLAKAIEVLALTHVRTKDAEHQDSVPGVRVVDDLLVEGDVAFYLVVLELEGVAQGTDRLIVAVCAI